MDERPSIRRRLAAILAVDIAGYSRLMGQDEAATVRNLKGHQAASLPLVGRHGGRIIDTAGDGILAEFPSVIGCIQPELYAAEHGRLKRKPPQSLDAWESFVRGTVLYSQHSDASTKEALNMLDRAVELDRSCAQAHGLCAVCLAWRAFQGWENRDTAFAEAAAGADRAVACDPQESWAYLAHGFIALARWRDSEAVGVLETSSDPRGVIT